MSAVPDSGLSQRDVLQKYTTVVADTGELEAIKKYTPQDATTNPSLVLKALAQLNDKDKEELLKLACDYALSKCGDASSLEDKLSLALDRIAVEFGLRILKLIPGNVSTELDARLSFDIESSVARGERIIAMYEELGVEDAKSRVLIKVASTWEGFQICKQLKTKGIRCNMTLLFSIYQAAAAAQIGGAFLISPFVGRITDWFKKERGVDSIDISEDPGPKSVTEIYRYYKTHKFETIVMGASFRSKAQILALTGCDYLTIGPKYLEELANTPESSESVKLMLEPGQKSDLSELLDVSEKKYRYQMCLNAMATEKLAEGIRKFAWDTEKLEKILRERFSS